MGDIVKGETLIGHHQLQAYRSNTNTLAVVKQIACFCLKLAGFCLPVLSGAFYSFCMSVLLYKVLLNFVFIQDIELKMYERIQ